MLVVYPRLLVRSWQLAIGTSCTRDSCQRARLSLQKDSAEETLTCFDPAAPPPLELQRNGQRFG